MAMGNESLAPLFSDWGNVGEPAPGVAARLSVDWNIIMQRLNGCYDNLDRIKVLYPEVFGPTKPLFLGNLFIGVRSRRIADFMARLHAPAMQAIGEANRRSTCEANLRRIALAMLIYLVHDFICI